MLVGLTTFLLLSSCELVDVKWRPNFYDHNYVKQEIIPAVGDVVSCKSPEFEEFVSLPRSDVRELALIIKEAKIPRDLQERLDEIVEELEKVAE